MKRKEKKELNKKIFAEMQKKARKEHNEKNKAEKIEEKKWSPEFIESILDQIADGKALKHICKENGVAFRNFYRKLNQDEELQKKYEEAVKISAANDFDEMQIIAQTQPRTIFDAQGNEVYDKSDIDYKKLQLDNHKWRLSRKDRKYSDKLELSGDPKNPIHTKNEVIDKTDDILNARIKEIIRLSESSIKS